MQHILAIDLGGTKTAVGIYDLEGTQIESMITFNSKSMDADEVFESIASPIRDLFNKYKDSIVCCGLGSIGPWRNNGELMTPPNIAAWHDFPFLARLREIVGDIVYFENDANALALAEGLMGAAKGEKNYMSMVVSTGIGGGIVVDGNLLHGQELNAGEIGHIILDINGPRCGIGCYGCVEAVASGPALEKKFGIEPKNATDEMKIYCADYVAHMLAIVVTATDVRTITIGGSVALGFGDIFFDRVRTRFNELWTIAHSQDIRIVPSSLGADGGLLGAFAVGVKAYRNLINNTQEALSI